LGHQVAVNQQSLRMLAGLEEVDSGRILIGGKDVTQVAPKDRDVAMVFQSYALYPHMSVAENMGFALKIAGTPKEERDRRVLEAAKLLDLEAFSRTQTKSTLWRAASKSCNGARDCSRTTGLSSWTNRYQT
jgi:ABC-type sugar transport system ATPase subunit